MKITDRINEILHRNRYIIPILQGLGIIALVTLISVISVNLLLGDSLTDYAEANPEIAYARHTEELPDDESAVEPKTEHLSEADSGSTVEPEAEPTIEPEAELTDEVSNDPASVESDITSDVKPETGIPEYNRSVMIHFYSPETAGEADNDQGGRYDYEPGFYYEPLTDDMIEYITGISYPASETSRDTSAVNTIAGTPEVSYDDLRYVGLLYIDFNGLTQAGELICNKRIAQDMVEIFHELYISDYRLDSVYLVDNYGGDDTASMCADNTSCFNYRVVEGSSSLSKHAYGLAIVINPFYNPYIVFGAGEGGSDYISPPGSEIYVDRSASFAYKIDDSDLCYRLFTSHGFKWGGDWNSCKDYQHFQKTP